MSFWWLLFIILSNGIVTFLLIYTFIIRRNRSELHAIAEALPKMHGGHSATPTLNKLDEMLRDADVHSNQTALISEEDIEILNTIKKLKKAYLLFDGPSTMAIGKKQKIIVEVFRNELIKLSISEQADISEITINKRLKMKLTGTDFDIKSLNSETQVVLPDRKTIWQWEIEPLKSGVKSLYLAATIALILNNKDEEYDYPVYSKDILVTVDQLYSLKKFWNKYWDKVLGIIFGSGIIWAILKALGVTK
ncbi:MAG: hypothetical protein QM731_01750 [Chitinophagaceae bacterium]